MGFRLPQNLTYFQNLVNQADNSAPYSGAPNKQPSPEQLAMLQFGMPSQEGVDQKPSDGVTDVQDHGQVDLSPPPQPNNGIAKLTPEEAQDNALRKAIIAKSQELVKQQEGEIPNLESLRSAYQTAQGPNLAPLLALSDTWTGSKFSENYKAPESAEEKATKLARVNEMIQKARQGVTGEQINLLKNIKEAGSARKEQTDARQLRSEQAKAIEMAKRMSPGGDPEIKKQFEQANLAQRMDELINKYPDLNKLNSSQIREVATQVARMLQGSSQLAQEQINGLIPHTGALSMAAIEAYLTNKNIEGKAGEFLTPMVDLAHREKNVSLKNMRDIQLKNAAGYEYLRTSKFPESQAAFERNLQKQAGLGLNQYDAESSMDNFSQLAGGPSLVPPQAPDLNTAPQSKVVGNTTYVLNPKTGKYAPQAAQ